MRTFFQWGRLACLLILLPIFLAWTPVNGQENQRFFPETGHVVSGDFLLFYERAVDPLLVYGYPITDAFIDPIYGRTTQYFQKGRFELYPDEPGELRVKLSPLGKFLYQPGQRRILPPNSPGCRTFREVEGSFQVCFAFLDFFKLNGGVSQFGYPISNLESHDGRIVQYFQKARFEWHPQLPTGQRVRLTDLGSLYFAQLALDQSYLRQQDYLPQTILSLKLRTFPEKPVTGMRGMQTIYVAVRDQNLLPVSGASITMRYRLPAGEEQELPIQAVSDENGLARLILPFETDIPGLISWQVTAQLDNLQGKTTGSFRAWW